jgi:hypothetical protein
MTFSATPFFALPGTAYLSVASGVARRLGLLLALRLLRP